MNNVLSNNSTNTSQLTPLGYDNFLQLINNLYTKQNYALKRIQQLQLKFSNENHHNNNKNSSNDSEYIVNDTGEIVLPYINYYGSGVNYSCFQYDILSQIISKLQTLHIPKPLLNYMRTGITNNKQDQNNNKVVQITVITQEQLLGPVKELFQLFKDSNHSLIAYTNINIKIIIQSNNYQLTIRTLCSDTIRILEQRINSQSACELGLNIPLTLHQKYEFNSEQTILDSKLWELEEIIVIPKDENYVLNSNRAVDTYPICIQTITGKKFQFSVFSSMSVEKLRVLIHQQLDALPEIQRLIFGGKQLEDGYCLKDYKIQSNSTLHLILRIGGSEQYWEAEGCNQNTNPLACKNHKSLALLHEFMTFIANSPNRTQIKTLLNIGELIDWLCNSRSLIAKIHSAVLNKNILGHSANGRVWIDDLPIQNKQIVEIEDEIVEREENCIELYGEENNNLIILDESNNSNKRNYSSIVTIDLTAENAQNNSITNNKKRNNNNNNNNSIEIIE